MPAISDLGTAIVTSLALALSMIAEAIPKIIGFIIILIIGWIVASLIAAAVAAVLRAVRFNDLGQRSGFSTFIHDMGLKTDPSGAIADLAKWFVRLITLVVAFDELGLTAVSQILNQILAWLPNLVVALVVLVIGGLIANFLSDLIRGSTAVSGLGNPSFLALIARYAVLAFAIIVALNQIGIAATLVDTLFVAAVGAIALALGLAFGLGGRETAAQMWREWYQRSQQVAPQLQQAAAAAATQRAAQTSAQSATQHPLRRATDAGQPSPAGPHPLRRATDVV
ncbi:MAG: small-conductance mechanosensitive ion channel [Chloroflexi bacterium]|nr:small-conductance mechanosensitive ion channel [Chloroflexota bacterium]MCL5951661.1 small-conductance mechanosensitive ion channel [Chloroflexota bacterium]